MFFLSESKTFLLADVQNMLVKHEMLVEFGGGETSKQGQAVETISCQANSVGQFRQSLQRLAYMFRSREIHFNLSKRT